MITVNFCPECGALLQVVKKGTTLLKCSKCKYQKPLAQGEIERKVNRIHCGKSVEIAVIDKKAASLGQLPTIKDVCQKCGHTESETWTVEAANETIYTTITFFRCTNCGTTRREAG